jgi:hypothetical protein
MIKDSVDTNLRFLVLIQPKQSKNGDVKAFDINSEEAKASHWKRIDRRKSAYWNAMTKRILPLYNAEMEDVLRVIGETKSEGQPPDAPRDDQGRWIGEGGGGSSASPLSARAIRAKQTHKTSTAAVQRQAESNEPKVAAAIIGGKQTGDNDVFDVLSKGNGVEVKTIVRGKNDKITTHPPSLARKVAYAEENNIQSHTVAFDDRNNKIYYKKGVGSFRLSSMKEIDLGDLREIIK